MDKFNQLKALIEGAEKDAEAFFNKNNKAAGTRLRNALQETKALSQEIRKTLQLRKTQNNSPLVVT